MEPQLLWFEAVTPVKLLIFSANLVLEIWVKRRALSVPARGVRAGARKRPDGESALHWIEVVGRGKQAESETRRLGRPFVAWLQRSRSSSKEEGAGEPPPL